MHIPSATYRVQLNKDFNLKVLHKLVPYLHKLGVSTIYASPLFKATPGSTHGYDVADPLKINEEVGSLEQWRALKRDLEERGMGWLQDIVPNHMAYSSSNPWLSSIFELGPKSPHYNSFDIDWDHPDEELKGKVMAPFLGTEPQEAVRNQELKANFEDGFYIQYYDHRYPASERSYSLLLAPALRHLNSQPPDQDKAHQNLKEIAEEFETPSKNEEDFQHKKNELTEYFDEDEAVHRAILQALDKINASPELLTEILDQQYFRFMHWRSTEQKINYRRFFTINHLICLRMEEKSTFDAYHAFIGELCREGLVDGLRIDHIDGLFDPEKYLDRLRKLVGSDLFTIVEKILEREEHLPESWPIQGSSGYVFLANVNQLFTDPEGSEAFIERYQGISEEMHPYEDLVFKIKSFILKDRMGGELQNLVDLLKTRNLMPKNDGTSPSRWKEALVGFLAAWPVYRIYLEEFPLKKKEKEVVLEAHERSRNVLPTLRDELDYLLEVFTGKAKASKKDQKYFLQRCQQFTGPLTAKGVEDTTFYTYNLLVSHNEVGDSPAIFGADTATFHRQMQHRQKKFPHSINGSATHDTKRGEDARMRINLLSEMPLEWFEQVDRWRKLNASAKVKKNLPDENEEYFIYQSLIGAWQQRIDEDFLTRTKQYLQKALREAKVHSNWSSPDENYENAVMSFLDSILKNEKFQESFEAFASKVAFFGSIYSLGQTLLKVTAPGIPDVYQGNELWDLSYVDPDNRRPVNYEQRMEFLEEISATQVQDFHKELLGNYANGKPKMFCLYQALQFRKRLPGLFEEGEYIPLKTSEEFAEKVLCFGRKYKNEYCVIAVPRQVLGLCSENEYPLGEKIWQDTAVSLPGSFPDHWINVFTRDKIQSAKGKVLLKDILSEFPVALLKPAADEV